MKRILIIRPDGIGDFVIFSAALEAYSKLYVGYQIDLLCHPKVTDMAVPVPFIHKVVGLDVFRLNHRKYLPYFLLTLLKLNWARYDKIIYPAYSRTEQVDQLVTLIRSKEKIAFDGDGANDPKNTRGHRNRNYTQIMKGSAQPMPEIERNQEFVGLLGLNETKDRKTRFWFADSDEADAQELLAQAGLVAQKYICLFPGAGAEIRYWDTANWVGLIQDLSKNYNDFKIVLLGAGPDRKTIHQILENLKSTSHIVNLYGKTTPRLLAKVIEHSRLLIAMETGAIHIAAAVGTPNICILGGGHYGRFYPYGDLSLNRTVYHKMDCFSCNWKCIYDSTLCIQKITKDKVLQEVQAVLMNQVGRNV